MIIATDWKIMRPGLTRFGRIKSIERKMQQLTAIVIFLFFLFSLCVGCRDREPDWQMIVKDPRSDIIYYSIPVKTMEEFTLIYRHSVSLSTVEGTFLITPEGRIKPLTTTFSTYGPGLPVDYAERYSIEDGLITVHSEEEPREEIRLWVSPQTEEKITLQGRVYDLAGLSESNLLLEITIEQKK